MTFTAHIYGESPHLTMPLLLGLYSARLLANQSSEQSVLYTAYDTLRGNAILRSSS